eukprot:comp23650_c0_seq1/m.40379 comp23650_c0_seq1/g.40379  ORF comp23650_c0_seq1/g.40379 comp23650_c0_seq1/m.40379 type:complete len:274 (-) comp23650_c0_seq1:746-1567(-)
MANHTGKRLFEGFEGCAFIGMVHLKPLPGSPYWNASSSMAEIVESATRDAKALKEGGCDALLVENMSDLPYLRGYVHPETTAAMTIAVHEVMKLGLPVGVQLLAGANREALGVCAATGASFIRAEAFAYGHLADEGWMNACAGELLRTRAHLFLQDKVKVWTDVKKKHSAHAATADLSISDIAKGTAFCGADALIVTGMETGAHTNISDVQAAKAGGLPVIVGSGVTPEDASVLARTADGLIVGSWIKDGGDWRKPVDVQRVRRIKEAVVAVL